jgi:hypothetical protein
MKKNTNSNISHIADPASLQCLAESLLYETTYHAGAYMHQQPTTITRYNAEFASNGGTTIVDGPLAATCKGSFSCAAHLFLEAEGINKCTSIDAYNLEDILPLLQLKLGLAVHNMNRSFLGTPKATATTRYPATTTEDATLGKHSQESNLPRVGLQNLTPFEVHRRTGFRDLK